MNTNGTIYMNGNNFMLRNKTIAMEITLQFNNCHNDND